MPRVSFELHARGRVPDDLIQDSDLFGAFFPLAEGLYFQLVLVFQCSSDSRDALFVSNRHEVITVYHHGDVGGWVAEQACVRLASFESFFDQRVGVLGCPVDGSVPRPVHRHHEAATHLLVSVCSVFVRQVYVDRSHRLCVEVRSRHVCVHHFQSCLGGHFADEHPQAFTGRRRSVQLWIYVGFEFFCDQPTSIVWVAFIPFVCVYPANCDWVFSCLRPAFLLWDFDVDPHLLEVLHLFSPGLRHQTRV